MNAWTVITGLLSWATAIWAIMAFAARVAHGAGRRIPLAERIHQKLWLFAGPGYLVQAVESWNGGHSWLLIFQALSLYWWWTLRDWPDDENKWRRRGRKLKEKIKVIMSGSRLVVGQVTA